jgi:DNA replicative helicase MCM subunit Mcm2 (Cdc46/Mcm family)
LGIDETLVSRFDGIVTMRDNADVETDKKVAETYGRAYTESQQKQYGEREDFNTLERQVPVDVGEAWIQYAREEVNPILHYEQFEELKEWYAEEVRQLNSSQGEADTEAEDMPVSATVRVLAAAVKMSIAFARVRLQDEVKQENVQRAKKLGKRLVKQNWDGEKFDASKNVRSNSQQERRDKIVEVLQDGPMTPSEVADEMREDHNKIKNDLKGDPRINELPRGRFERK